MKITASIKVCLTLVFLSFASLAQAGNLMFADHPLVGKIWDMNSRSYIDEATLFARIKTSDVLLLGETHDNAWHHDRQQQLLKARIEPGVRPALMMEMLNAENQQELDQALAGSNRDEVLKSINSLIRFTDWQFYSPLLVIAVDNKLPVIAGNVSSRYLQPAIRKGYAAYDAGEIERLAVEEVWNESREKYLLTQMGGAHGGELGEEWRRGLARSHRLRDASMADSAISRIGRGVVAIVGRGHARRDIGLPIYFAARAPSARVISIGFVEVSPGMNDPEDYDTGSATGEAPYDLVWFSPRNERIDPCANFGKPREAQQP